MRPEESLYPADWLRIAEKDFERVRRLLGVQDAEAAGFFLQQALEKFFKAFLLSKGWQLRRTHDLEVLLNEAIIYAPGLEPFRPVCQKVSGFYLVERYPLMLGSGISETDVQGALKDGADLVEYLREAVNNPES